MERVSKTIERPRREYNAEFKAMVPGASVPDRTIWLAWSSPCLMRHPLL